MIYNCSIDFTVGRLPRCNGELISLSSSSSEGNYIVCSVPYVLNAGRLRCNGSRTRTSDIQSIDGSYYLFSADTATLNSRNQILPSDTFNNVLVSDYVASIPVDPEPPTDGTNTGLTAAEYASLLEIALTPLVIAFSFKFLYRFIMNR